MADLIAASEGCAPKGSRCPHPCKLLNNGWAPCGLLLSPLDTGSHEKHVYVFEKCTYNLYGENLGVQWIATVADAIIWVNSAKTL